MKRILQLLKSLKTALIGITIGSLLPMPANAQVYTVEDYKKEEQNYYHQLQATLQSAPVISQFASIQPLSLADCRQRFDSFNPHKEDISVINHDIDPARILQDEQFSEQSRNYLEIILTVPAHSEFKEPLMNWLGTTITREQIWRILAILDRDRHFKLCALVSDHLYQTAQSQEEKELCSLIGARYQWITLPPYASNYNELLKSALMAQDIEVRKQAELWQRALTQPSSPDDLLLCFQIWECVHREMNNIIQSNRLSILINKESQAVIAQLMPDVQDPESREKQLDLIANASEAAFQQLDFEGLTWLEQYVGQHSLLDDERGLAPAYQKAYCNYAVRRYEEARAIFEKPFLHGEACDIAAAAGVMMARCDLLLKNDISALATLSVVQDFYSEQGFVLQAIPDIESLIFARSPDITGEMVTRYITDHYEAKLAQLGKLKTKKFAMN